ncbi:hypothetical protein K8F61_18025 [Microbacterium resistens]|uniref:Uncharacterized protein n=1 Tax=Microbacterium resistens TaxID=156977 RepID=A0ABY3RQY0_9MICO|nr:hypothetical protein [Microbacterium resistens]UGS26493.1 hypothetical protein K8F61_18025 [Microbacterium resistens]
MNARRMDLSWIADLDPTGTTVASYTLRSHAATVRVLNPAHDRAGNPVTWASVGSAPFRLRSDVQWTDVQSRSDRTDIEEPLMGTVDDTVAVALLAHLAPLGPILVAQWEGYADADVDARGDALHVEFPPERPCTVSAVHADDLLRARRRPMRWWDPGRTWMAGNDIYARSLFVSGPETLISGLLADPALEAFRVSTGDQVLPEDRTLRTRPTRR